MRTIVTALVLCVLLPGFCGSAAGKVYIDIHAPAASRLPILVPEFTRTGGPPDTAGTGRAMAGIIAADLEFSGVFRILDPAAVDRSYLQGLTGETIRWDVLSVIGAEAIVTGGYQLMGDGRLQLELRLFDAVQGRFLVGKKYEAPADDHRAIAHRFANEVFEKLTGQPGIFTTRIAFVLGSGASKELAVMDYDGGNRTQLTWYKSLTLCPAWSPDAGRLAFTSYKDGNPDLYVKDVYRGETQKISRKKGINITPAWSPDGRKIALTLTLNNGNSEIYALELGSKKLERLTRNWAIDVSPTWSPDGKHLAFVSSRSGYPQVYRMDLGRGTVKRLTYSGNENVTPAWSPTGDDIAYTGRIAGAFNIVRMGSDGRLAQQLTAGHGNCEDPAWSPDGRCIAFSSDQTGQREIYIMRADGTGIRQVTRGPGSKSEPSWSRPYTVTH